MVLDELSGVVFDLVSLVQPLPTSGLEREWLWKGYEEGIRFACFRVMERLRLLAAEVEQVRLVQGCPVTAAQRALAQYHVAFREMQAVLWDISDEDGGRAPAEGEWSLRQILPHIIGADRAFFIVIQYTLERARTNDDLPLEMSDEYFDAFQRSDEFPQIAEKAPLSMLVDYYTRWHPRVLGALSTIRPEELSLPSIFWEPQPMPVQFRLHRFESHLRQHSIQIEKTLAALDLNQHEAASLARLILAALGEAEGAALGAPEDCHARLVQDCTAELAGLTQEIRTALEKPER